MLVHQDRETRQGLHDDLLRDFPELPAGVVMGAVTRARRDLHRLGRAEGLWDAVELVARARLLELLALRAPATAGATAGRG